jgi:hypothetical protein
MQMPVFFSDFLMGCDACNAQLTKTLRANVMERHWGNSEMIKGEVKVLLFWQALGGQTILLPTVGVSACDFGGH